MNSLIIKYNSIIDSLPDNIRFIKDYIHHRTLHNFILHIDELENDVEHQEAYKLIDEYMTMIQEIIIDDVDKINRMLAFHLYRAYLKPLIHLYKKIGFKEIHRLKYHIAFSIPIDIAVGLILWKFPYPFFTIVALVYEFVRNITHKKFTRYYKMFY